MKSQSPESMSKHLAVSSSVLLNISANPFWCGVSGMVFSRNISASKQYILNCSERISFVMSCLSFLGVPTLRTLFSRMASASFFDLNKSANLISGLQVTILDSDSTLKGPITSVNTLSSFSSAWVPVTLGTGVFVILVKVDTLQTSSSFPNVCGTLLTTSALLK